jgi:superfamily II helicase
MGRQFFVFAQKNHIESKRATPWETKMMQCSYHLNTWTNSKKLCMKCHVEAPLEVLMKETLIGSIPKDHPICRECKKTFKGHRTQGVEWY